MLHNVGVLDGCVCSAVQRQLVVITCRQHNKLNISHAQQYLHVKRRPALTFKRDCGAMLSPGMALGTWQHMWCKCLSGGLGCVHAVLMSGCMFCCHYSTFYTIYYYNMYLIVDRDMCSVQKHVQRARKIFRIMVCAAGRRFSFAAHYYRSVQAGVDLQPTLCCFFVASNAPQISTNAQLAGTASSA